MFNHYFVPEISLQDEMRDGKRYYILPDGRAFKSVTTILSEKTDKSSLEKWRKRVGEEEANRISAIATRRGSIIHGLCENYLHNKPDYMSSASPDDIDSFLPLRNILREHVDDIYGIELPLYSTVLEAAGRTDLIAKFDGELSIIDFKTSKKPKQDKWIENYYIQTTAYSLMFEELYNIKIKKLAILITVDHDVPQIFVKNTKDYYNRVRDIFC